MFSDRPENHDDKRSDGNVSTVVTIAMLELVNTVCNYVADNLSSCRDKWKRNTARGGGGGGGGFNQTTGIQVYQ